MEESLKKRLIGAAVLASLAVIFVPMLVEEPVDKAELVRTPPAPPAKPFESRLLRGELPRPAAPLPPTRRVPAEQPVSPGSDQGAGPGQPLQTGLSAWVVQVGSFSNQDNARKLVAKLRQAGFQARDPDPIELRGKIIYRVQVGPVLEKQRALEMLPRINKVSGTTGSVLAYP